MPYHVEVRRAHSHARAFNLSERELRETVLEPWSQGRALELGDQRWERRDSRLRILEGPRLSGPDLAYGQGWNRAERSAREVTRDLLAGQAQTVAVLASTQPAADAAARVLEALGLVAVDWSTVARGPILTWLLGADRATDLSFAAALLIGAASVPEWWLLEAGIALGALGARAALVQFDGEPSPAPLRELEVLHLDPRAPADLERLRARLRRAGCEVAAVRSR
jgi:hypothetical protein